MFIDGWSYGVLPPSVLQAQAKDASFYPPRLYSQSSGEYHEGHYGGGGPRHPRYVVTKDTPYLPPSRESTRAYDGQGHVYRNTGGYDSEASSPRGYPSPSMASSGGLSNSRQGALSQRQGPYPDNSRVETWRQNAGSSPQTQHSGTPSYHTDPSLAGTGVLELALPIQRGTGSSSATSTPPPAPLSEADKEALLRHELKEFIPAHKPLCISSLPKAENRTKPGLPYHQLVALLIWSSPQQRLSLRDIYAQLIENIAWYRDHDSKDKGTKGESDKWKSSIRHMLSLKGFFVHQRRPATEPGPGDYWVLNFDHWASNSRDRKRAPSTSARRLSTSRSAKPQGSAGGSGSSTGVTRRPQPPNPIPGYQYPVSQAYPSSSSYHDPAPPSSYNGSSDASYGSYSAQGEYFTNSPSQSGSSYDEPQSRTMLPPSRQESYPPLDGYYEPQQQQYAVNPGHLDGFYGMDY